MTDFIREGELAASNVDKKKASHGLSIALGAYRLLAHVRPNAAAAAVSSSSTSPK